MILKVTMQIAVYATITLGIVLLAMAISDARKQSMIKKQMKYEVGTDTYGWTTDHIKEENGCVTFISKKKNHKLCGNYQIVERYAHE